MTSRQVVLLLTLAVLLFEADLIAQRGRTGSGIRRVFAICIVPLIFTFAIVVYRRWHQFQ
jgi:hypothetical protein